MYYLSKCTHMQQNSQVFIINYKVHSNQHYSVTGQHLQYFDAHWGIQTSSTVNHKKLSRITPSSSPVASSPAESLSQQSSPSSSLSTLSIEMNRLKKVLWDVDSVANKYYELFNCTPHSLVGAALIRLFIIDVMGIIITTICNCCSYQYQYTQDKAHL